MQLIRCPWCGPREETEFCFGGQAHVAYPAEPAALSDEQWARFVFVRANPRGMAAERWRHAAACGRWFNVVRDTRTYEFHATYPIGKPRPPELGERSDGGMTLGAHTLVESPDRTAVAR